MRLRTFVSGLTIVGLTFTGSVRAEVAAKLDEYGDYAGMVVKYNGTGNRRVWSGGIPTPTRRPLNPTGDVLGDLVPTVVENRAAMRWPMAVWSHPNGIDYDLVFSKWTGSGWTPTQFVQTDNFFNDLDPRFGFNSVGRPYLVWWSDENGIAAVYFSMFLETRWMTPVRVSTQGVDSRRADLVIENNLRVTVSFDTYEARQTRTVSIPNRDSITDDIDPKIRSEITVY